MSGTYTISLTVSNSQGSNTSPKTNVTVSPAPTVNFSASTVKGCFPVSTNFNDMSSTSTGNNIVLWNWTFGDGGASTARNPSHTYTGLGILLKDTSAIQYNWDFGNGQSSSMANPSAINYLVGGNFVVKLHTSSANGCTADTSQKVLVNSVPNLFAGNDTTVCFGTKVA